MNTPRAADIIDSIGHAGVKSPFTFWVLLGVVILALVMAAGSFWLLNIQLQASQNRYDRLFTVMEQSAKADNDREEKMIFELQETRKEYSQNLKSVVANLVDQAPRKMDEEMRREMLAQVNENTNALKRNSEDTKKILQLLDRLSLQIDGKTGR